MQKNTAIAPKITENEFVSVLEQIAAEQAQLAERVAALRALARGTDDVTAEAARAVASAHPVPAPVAPVEPEPRTLAERVERVLLRRALSVDDLCREVHAPPGPVSAIVRRYRGAKHVYNLGTEDSPRWLLRIGDETTTQVLAVSVEAAVRERPLTLQELVAVTGARRNRVSGVLAKMSERPVDPVVNLGSSTRGRWFMPYSAAAHR